MANQHGGARPGSGRPCKSEKYAGPIVQAEDKIADRLPEVVDALVASAKGGDTKAGIYLLDRIMGKVPQALEHTGADGGDIRHAVMLYLPRNGREPNVEPDPD